jgi:hypothetical protein
VDLVRGRIGEGRAEDEDHLVLGTATPRKDVLQHAEQPHVGQPLTDLLEKLPVDGVPRVLAELDMTAERSLKRRLR